MRASFRLPGGGASYYTMLRQLQGATGAIRRDLANLRPPTLILWGDRDSFGPPDNARQVARVELLHDAGHLPWFDCPDAVASFARSIQRAAAPTSHEEVGS